MNWKSLGLVLLALLLIAAVPDRNPDRDPPPDVAPRPCNACEDLCRLVDTYLQKEKGIELWRRYAASTPEAQRTRLPPGVTDTDGIENLVWKEFSEWAKNRRQNRELPCKLREETAAGQAGAPVPPPAAVAVDLVTVTQQDSCEIRYGNRKLEGEALRDYERSVDCKVLSDATIAHEAVHQEHCMRAFAEDHRRAPALLDTPAQVAESELQAWKRHQEVVGEAIRALAGKCGWQPTKRQLRDMTSIPSAAQTRAMQERGWKAAEALGGSP